MRSARKAFDAKCMIDLNVLTHGREGGRKGERKKRERREEERKKQDEER